MEQIKDQSLYKISPKLRMVRNGDKHTNTARAQLAAAIRVTDEALLNEVQVQREPTMRARSTREKPPTAQERGSMEQKEPADDIQVNAFIQLAEEAETLPTAVRYRHPERRQDLLAVTMPLSKIDELRQDPRVNYVELAERIVFSPPLDSQITGEEPRGERHVETSVPHNGGEGVLIGIVDVQGFDFSHPDFLNENGQTRFVSIWDQGSKTRPTPSGFDYGAEIIQANMNAAIAASQAGIGAAPYQLEPQSQMIPGSHGTHVASIAAGKEGICPQAHIAAVLISLPPEDEDRRKSFYDSTRISHAIDYLFKLGVENGWPVSINVSLGTNGHAHDASSAVSRWLDYALATSGRCICVAAGNAGQEAPVAPGDWGYVMGRIHTGGKIPATGLVTDLEWIVVGDGIADVSENELEIWYSPQDRFAVQVRPPATSAWIGPLEPGEFIENHMLKDGTIISIYNELYYPANGANTIAIYLSPFLSDNRIEGVRAGLWQVRLIGLQVRDGSYHGWIERDDPRRWGRLGASEAWSFPSFFSAATNVDDSSMSSLACGQRVIAVANMDQATERINVTSSQGPTRDRREKPEVAAPGTNIVAANGFDPTHQWISKTGTSMASPYGAGVVGLMLAVQPQLTAAQIVGLMRRSAQPLPGATFGWVNDAGFGRIDAVAAVENAAAIGVRRDLTDET
jgi:subtilisin family serine protease